MTAIDSLDSDTQQSVRASGIAARPTQVQPLHRLAKWLGDRLDAVAATAFGLLALVLRLAFRAHQPTDFDSVHYTRAIAHFDVVQYWPHAPGYWLYVFTGRVIHWLSPLGPHDSLLLATAVASSAVVSLTYLIGAKVADRTVGVVGALVMMTVPVMWFYGSIVATKSFDALGLTLLLWLAYKAKPGSRVGVVACVVLGLLGGVRPSAMFLFAPITLYILVLCRPGIRRLAMCVLAGGVALAAWLVPMSLEQPGGLAAVRAQSKLLLDGSMQATSILVGSPGARANALEVIGVTLMSVLPLLPLLLVALPGVFAKGSVVRRSRVSVYAPLVVATAPGMLEAFLVHFGTPGYAMSFLPALVLAVVLPLRGRSLHPIATGALVIVVMAVCSYQTDRFTRATYIWPQRLTVGPWAPDKYGAPYNETYTGIEKADDDQVSYRDIGSHFDPAKDVLVYVSGNGEWRYRPGGYQLPEFTVHLVDHGNDIDQARAGRHTTVVDHVIEVPTGGRAVLVLDQFQSDLEDMQQKGIIQPVHLATGPTVYALQPGHSALGVDFVNAPLPEI